MTMQQLRTQAPLKVLKAEFSFAPPDFVLPQKMTGKRAAGLRYEKALTKHLSALYGNAYMPSPWIKAREAIYGRLIWRQPDGLLMDAAEKKITIIECKLQHTDLAWYQLRHVYLPLIEYMFDRSKWTICVCEVVKWYDPAVSFPEKVTLVSDITQITPQQFGVHIWTP